MQWAEMMGWMQERNTAARQSLMWHHQIFNLHKEEAVNKEPQSWCTMPIQCFSMTVAPHQIHTGGCSAQSEKWGVPSFYHKGEAEKRRRTTFPSSSERHISMNCEFCRVGRNEHGMEMECESGSSQQQTKRFSAKPVYHNPLDLLWQVSRLLLLCC